MSYQLHRGDCLDILPTLAENSVDSVITDPPGGISFMGKKWDSDRGGRDRWIEWLTAVLSECYRVLKPGGMCLVWAIPRTSHWTGMAIENAGFEVRDCIYHLFGSGFPKSLSIDKAIDKAAGVEQKVVGQKDRYRDGRKRRNLGNASNWGGTFGTNGVDHVTAPATAAAQQFVGYGTSLKPAAEVWWLAMKPIPSTFAANALEHGVAGLNIDGCRVPTGDNNIGWNGLGSDDKRQVYGKGWNPDGVQRQPSGRWPANLILDPEAGRLLDEQSGERPSRPATYALTGVGIGHNGSNGHVHNGAGGSASIGYPDSGGPSRFFYTAKASKRERNQGMPDGRTNKHPTVKPLELCRFLCRLTRTPTGGVVLDPFLGSGSIGIAAVAEGRDFIGIEQDAQSFETAVWRIEHEYWREDVQIEGVQLELAHV